MGHYRQYLIRGRGRTVTDLPPVDPLTPPDITSAVSGGGWNITLTAPVGADPAAFMTLYYGPSIGAISVVADFGLVSGSPQTQYVDGIYGHTYWSSSSSLVNGGGLIGPIGGPHNTP
jgi:hypothetical protein